MSEPLSNSNRKYGLEVYHFTLPVEGTCLHQTRLCSEICYGHRIWHNVRDRYEANLEFSKEAGFVDAVVRQVRERGIKHVRVHAIGDFYSNIYLNKWVEIARLVGPGCRFLAYTRNNELDYRAVPPNFVIFYSVDATSPLGPLPPGLTRRAFLFQPPAPRVFYNHIEGCDYHEAPVCVGKCAWCKYCWSGRGDVAFPMRRGRKTYAPEGEKYMMSWYLRRDGKYVPKGGLKAHLEAHLKAHAEARAIAEREYYNEND